MDSTSFRNFELQTDSALDDPCHLCYKVHEKDCHENFILSGLP